MPRLTRSTVVFLFLMLAALAMFAAACGGDAGEVRRTAADFAGEELVVLTHDSFAISEETIAAFETEFDVTVKIVPIGDASMPSG